MNEREPIRIPLNNTRALEGLIMREFASYTVLMARGSWDTSEESDKCKANYDILLDHYPGGVRRSEVSVEQANEAIYRLGQQAVSL